MQGVYATTSISASFTKTKRYSTTSIILTLAGFISAKGPDWRPKVKARDTPKDIAAPDLLPAGLQSETEYVQRIDCAKENPTTALKATTITVKEARVTANPKDQNEIRHINHNYNRDSVSAKGDGDFIRNYYFYCHGRPHRDRYCD